MPSYLKCKNCQSLFYTAASDLKNKEEKKCSRCGGKLEEIGQERWEEIREGKRSVLDE